MDYSDSRNARLSAVANALLVNFSSSANLSSRFVTMAEKRRSPCTMSLKAHAFSVEALIGTEKKRKLEEDNENCFEEVNEVSSLTESPQPQTRRTCPSTRSCDIDCASDESRK